MRDRDDEQRTTGGWSEIRRRGVGTFAGDVVRRLRAADGTSHVRALAYQTMFVILSGFVGLIGLARVLDIEQLRGVVTQFARSLMPGPSSRVIEQALQQGAQRGATAAVIGLGAAVGAGTFAMAQLERSANRLAMSDEDRPGVRRYAAAAILSVSVGTLFLLAALLLAGGGALARGLGWGEGVVTTWTVLRWPLGLVLVVAAVAAAFRFAPRERLRSRGLVTAGTVVAAVSWAGFTALLAGYFAIRGDGDDPYGPLLGIIALLLWSMLTSLALHLGLATSYELERAHAGEDEVVTLPEAPPERETAPSRVARPLR
jgi:uncharacterized BrkB/YihY/UPF0761 family membrane protein